MINEALEQKARAHCESTGETMDNTKVFVEYSNFEVKANEAEGCKIAGYLSTFKNVDRQNDIVLATAFDKTIKGLKMLPMLRDHCNCTDDQVGSWVKFKVDEVGLYVEGVIVEDEETAHLLALIKGGHLNTLSMGGLFKYAPRPDNKGYSIIEEVVLLEGSIVSIPANPLAKFEAKSLASEPEEVAKSEPDEVDYKSKAIAVYLDLIKKGLN